MGFSYPRPLITKLDPTTELHHGFRRNMAEVTPHSPSASNRLPDGDHRVSVDRSSDTRYDEASFPTPPATSAPAGLQDSPRTAFDTSELRERMDGVLQSDVRYEAHLQAGPVAKCSRLASVPS